MEVKIDNGVIAENGLGLPEMTEGADALLQRVYNRLNTVRGGFCYDPAFGSRIPCAEEWDRGTVLQFAREALLPCPEIWVEDAVLFGDRAEIRIETTMGSGTVTVYRKEKRDDL